MIGVLSTCFQERHRPSDRQERLIDLCARQAVDFIENAQLYDQLREADRRKDEFLATLGHELRNPLAPISNSMHLLRLDRDLSPTAQRLCEVMERQIKHMMRLVDDMLEVSRITRGKIELRKEQVPLASIISSAVELSRPLIDGADHQLAITLPQDPVIVEVDSVRLTQVVANLLNNAAKYTQDGGQIWLNAHREGNEVLIAVRDTGAGIPADMLPHVFDMFAQVNRTLTRAQGGLGIGLTLVKSLVEMHGGRVRASSEGPGKGSEFLIRLPVAKEVEPSATLTDKPRQPRSIAAMGAHRIVIVDDRRDSAFVLATLLEMLNQDVRTASDAVSALEMIRRDRPDIVISDIGMPEVDGYELARRIRAVPEFHDIVLVALTGFGQAGDKQRAKDAGFDMHLIKPVSASALEDLIATMPIQRGRADRSHV